MTADRPRGLALLPPPLLFAVPLIAGLWLNQRYPLLPPTTSRVPQWLGMALIAAGAAHALTSIMLFVTSRTTIIPHGHASTFVQGGAYRWTRNPMYVGLTLVYVGTSVLMTAVWPILFLLLPLMILDQAIIPMEERHLEQAFGADYVAYKSRVRRWL